MVGSWKKFNLRRKKQVKKQIFEELGFCQQYMYLGPLQVTSFYQSQITKYTCRKRSRAGITVYHW